MPGPLAPHTKFVFLFNTAKIPPRNTFTLRLAVRNLETGFFSNPDLSYYAAPQEIDPSSGIIRGHSHLVLQRRAPCFSACLKWAAASLGSMELLVSMSLALTGEPDTPGRRGFEG